MPNSDALDALARDLTDIFEARFQSLVTYGRADQVSGGAISTLALVGSLMIDDLRACAARVATWHDAGLATPLILSAREFDRSLDAFPFEFGAIIDEHTVVVGRDPFEGLRVQAGDLRRACEVQARSHLLHLREGYIETGDRVDALIDLVTRSVDPLAALLRNLARLDGAAPTDAVLARVAQIQRGTLSGEEARRMFPEYLQAMEHLTGTIDRWSPA
jgi:hypothetical protein